jgi:hypothetical protein
MEQSKLVQLLRSLSAREWRLLRDFWASPYFNKNPQMLAFCDWLRGQVPGPGPLTREAAHAALFPGEPCDEARLNHLMSAFLKGCERFLALEKGSDDGFSEDFHLLQALAERNLDKHYTQHFEKKCSALEASPYRDARFFWEKYALENLEANRRSRSNARQFNQHVQNTADQLDAFYLSEKLRCTCYMLTSQFVIATPYNLQLVDELRRFIAQNALPTDNPALRAYYHIFQLLTQPQADADFEALRVLLIEQERRFRPAELSELYEYAINYCNMQIMKVREPYVATALELYRSGVEKGILLQEGQLSPWHFKNIIKLGLRLEQYGQTKQFILDNTPLLPPEHRDDALHYNLAELYYYTKNNQEAMRHLNKVEFSDIHYNLSAKLLLAKIYYETDAHDALESLLHAFKTFLYRNKLISSELRRTYLNFIELLGLIVRSTPDKRPQLAARIEQAQLLAGKSWLLRVL